MTGSLLTGVKAMLLLGAGALGAHWIDGAPAARKAVEPAAAIACPPMHHAASVRATRAAQATPACLPAGPSNVSWDSAVQMFQR
ncbi:hypothetical protein [Piscinibacter sp.]|uniref:hypothetical protein n=1 Tax=Piscinibacter sp. TaxID=1903157 RepID=UPI0039E21FEB